MSKPHRGHVDASGIGSAGCRIHFCLCMLKVSRVKFLRNRIHFHFILSGTEVDRISGDYCTGICVCVRVRLVLPTPTTINAVDGGE